MAAPDLQQLAAVARDWKGENQQSPGELWLGLLRYYVVKYSQHGVSIRQSKPLLRIRRMGRGSSRLAVEDPIICLSNMARASGVMECMNTLLAR